MINSKLSKKAEWMVNNSPFTLDLVATKFGTSKAYAYQIIHAMKKKGYIFTRVNQDITLEKGSIVETESVVKKRNEVDITVAILETRFNGIRKALSFHENKMNVITTVMLTLDELILKLLNT